ncbi:MULTISPECIES: hypothetical protein [unclassified Paenibacillus]|uniref:hypothetical protein n=1 Tax=unclassified Paenibacillus TaxID=185978 RepID=UPI003629CA76
MTSVFNKNGCEFLECISLNEHALINYKPLAGSFAVRSDECRVTEYYLIIGRVNRGFCILWELVQAFFC